MLLCLTTLPSAIAFNKWTGRGPILLKSTLTGHTVVCQQSGSCRNCSCVHQGVRSGLEPGNTEYVRVTGGRMDNLSNDKK